MKPKLKPPGTKPLKLTCDVPLSTYAFKFNLRRYNEGDEDGYDATMVTTMLGAPPPLADPKLMTDYFHAAAVAAAAAFLSTAIKVGL
jgi:hypothetical protein